MVDVMTPCVSTKQLGVSSARAEARAAASALAFDAEVDVMSDFGFEERLNRFIDLFYTNDLYLGFTLGVDFGALEGQNRSNKYSEGRRWVS